MTDIANQEDGFVFGQFLQMVLVEYIEPENILGPANMALFKLVGAT
jgi:hypothetical protein